VNACKLFDSFFLLAVVTPIAALELLTDDLVCFDYPEFEEEFVTLLKTEISLSVKHSQQPFDWDTIEKSTAILNGRIGGSAMMSFGHHTLLQYWRTKFSI
jgi:hypothetical protein